MKRTGWGCLIIIIVLVAAMIAIRQPEPTSIPAERQPGPTSISAERQPGPTSISPQRQATELGKWDGVNGVRWGEKASSVDGLRLNELASSGKVKVYRLTENGTKIGGVPGKQVDLWFYNDEFFHCTMGVDRENLAKCRTTLLALYGEPKEHVIEGNLELRWDSDNVSVSMVYYRDGGDVLDGDVVWEYKPIASRCFPAENRGK